MATIIRGTLKFVTKNRKQSHIITKQVAAQVLGNFSHSAVPICQDLGRVAAFILNLSSP